MDSKKAFEEAQRFEGPWWHFYKAPMFVLWAVSLGPIALSTVLLGERYASVGLLVGLLSVSVGLLALALIVDVRRLYRMRMSTVLADGVLRVTYGQTGGRTGTVAVAVSDVVDCRVEPCSRFRACGCDPRLDLLWSTTTMIVVVSNQAVKILLANGKEYVIGSDRADELAMAIKSEIPTGGTARAVK